MKRVHVLEFEDLSWFPAWLRALMTNLLSVLLRMMGVTDVLAALVARVLKDENIDQVVDLGSGSGGAMPEIIERLREDPGLAQASLTMTDLYPNPDAIDAFNQPDTPHVRYLAEPVNAQDLASAPAGLKTMVNSVHHMRPATARAILESAQESRQALLIYELGDNKIPFALWCLALPLSLVAVFIMALFLTPFARPLTFRQLFFAYVIPIVPILYAWDGQASMPRIYTFDDVDELLEGLESSDYQWEKGYAKTEKGRNMGTYILGRPC